MLTIIIVLRYKDEIFSDLPLHFLLLRRGEIRFSINSFRVCYSFLQPGSEGSLLTSEAECRRKLAFLSTYSVPDAILAAFIILLNS